MADKLEKPRHTRGELLLQAARALFFCFKGGGGTGPRQTGPCPAAARNHFRVQRFSQPAAAPG